MDGEQWQQAVDFEQNETELVTANQWSLWKTFLVSLLACLIATALVVLVLYFAHFGKPTNITTILIHADGTSNHVTCIPGSTSSLASMSLPGSQSTLPSNPVANQSSSTKVPRSAMKTTKTTTWDHEIIIENKKRHF